MKVSVFKEYLKLLLDDDLKAVGRESFNLPTTTSLAGHVRFQREIKKFENIDIVTFPDTGISQIDSPAITLFKDGSAEIRVAKSELYELTKTPTRLKAVLAHEVGHYLTNNSMIPNYITPDSKGKQTRFLELYHKFPDLQGYDQKYHRAMFSSLLRGGVMYKELSADLAAAEYVPIDSLIALHSDKLRHENVAVRLEAHNRIKELAYCREEAYDEETKSMKVKLWGIFS